MQPKTKLTLEQTQQGVSEEVLVSIEVVEELKRNVKINGEKKEALLTLRQKLEHQSDTKVLTMTMEILSEPTSNKLCDRGNNFRKDETIKYEHVGPKVTSTQDGKRSQDDDKRLYSPDDLKKLKDHMQVKLKGTSSSLKSKDNYTYHKLKDKIQEDRRHS
ncbi:hypothetical protein Tco_0439362 [Tanacetum coccineum]